MEVKGIYPVVPATLLSSGAVDMESVDKLAAFMVKRGVHGLAVLGAERGARGVSTRAARRPSSSVWLNWVWTPASIRPMRISSALWGRRLAKACTLSLDLIGGALFPQTLEAIAPRGRLIPVGLRARLHAGLDLSVVTRKRLRIEGTVLRSRSEEEKTVVTQSFTEAVLPLFAARRLRPVVDRVFSFGAIQAALEQSEFNPSFGNVFYSLSS